MHNENTMTQTGGGAHAGNCSAVAPSGICIEGGLDAVWQEIGGDGRMQGPHRTCDDAHRCRVHVKTFDRLTVHELYALLRTRSEVFIVEQDCVYQDVDDNDQTAIHLWMTCGEKIVAMCRVCPGGTKMEHVSFGRVVTTERGKGYGAVIVELAIGAARRFLGRFDRITIESQATKQGFYEKFGFVATSEPFMMEGLPHLNMVLDMRQ